MYQPGYAVYIEVGVKDIAVPTSTFQRPATTEELATIAQLLSKAPTAVTRLKRGIGNAVILWAASLLAAVVIWLGLGWIAGKVLGVNLGLRSQATVWVVAIATPLCAVFAVVSSIRWVQGWKDDRPQLHEDLARSLVIDEKYVFSEAKRFQEPEHGGLVYFLRSTENEVFTVYDYESQTLGVEGSDPLRSGYRPLSNLHIVRAPRSGLVLSSQSTGAQLSVPCTIELAAPPHEWPESEELCVIPWPQLEERLGSGRNLKERRSDA